MMYDGKWLQRMMGLAEYVASWSKDPSTKVGCVIADGKFIVSVGYNGFPKRVKDTNERYSVKSEKYPRIVHAEMNAILSSNVSLSGCSAFVTAPCCASCAAALIQKDISHVYMLLPSEDFMDRWKESLSFSMSMFDEAGVCIHTVRKNALGFYSLAGRRCLE